MVTKLKVVILAGGYGTRISDEGALRPKPMIEIGGAPILWHIMKHYSHYGFNDFVICCGHMTHVIKEYFADYYLHRSNVTFDFTNGGRIIHSNEAEPWRVTVAYTGHDTQTGGRIKRIQEFIGNERFMLTYGDGVSDIDLSALLDIHKSSGKAVTLSAIQPSGRFGILDINDRDSTITGFREKAQESNSWINAGFMVVEPEIFNYIDGDSTILERAPLENLSVENKLGVYRHHGYWACMDTPRDRSWLENAWKKGNAKWKVWDN